MTDINLEPEEEMTFIEKMLANQKLFAAMLSMPREQNQQMTKARRHEKFSIFWENTELSQEQVLQRVKSLEDSFVDRYDDCDVPDWVIRCDAQDEVIKMIYDQFAEEGLV